MAAAATPTRSTGTTTPPISANPGKVKTPPREVKHARYLADINDTLDDVDHFASMRDNDGFIDAVQKSFRAIQRELSGVGEIV